jgi:hypothetical protein
METVYVYVGKHVNFKDNYFFNIKPSVWTFWNEIIFTVLWCEVRTLCALDWCSSAWAMPPELFALGTFEIGSYIYVQATWTVILQFTLPTVTGLTGLHHHAHLCFVKLGSHELFARAGLLPQFSHVTGITVTQDEPFLFLYHLLLFKDFLQFLC